MSTVRNKIVGNKIVDTVYVDEGTPIPRHIAIIMDGNGRWARRRDLRRLNGHHEGIKALKRTVKAAQEIGLDILTVYAFSTENWSRPAIEVDGLVTLLREQLDSNLSTFVKNNIRVRIIGSRRGLSSSVLEILENTEEQTSHNTGLFFIIAFNYGSRREIVEAARSFASDVKKGKRVPEELNEELLGTYLYTTGIPDPDLLIRTSGVFRISNYLLWQMAYTEIMVTDTLWPDFGKSDLIAAIRDYQSRERRYGKTSDQI